MRYNNPVKLIIEEWLPATMNGDGTHKTKLKNAIHALSSPEHQGDLLDHLKTHYTEADSLESCDPDVLVFLSQWVEALTHRSGSITMAEVKQANWEWALRVMAIAAEVKKYPRALYLSASKYGTGIPHTLDKDIEKSIALLKEAADLGDPMAQHDYAQNCQRGAGEILPKDPAMALQYFQQAAEQNFGPSQEALAAHYFNQAKDYAKGFNYLTKSAENKHGSAAYQLAQLYAKGFQQEDFAIPLDSQKAMYYLKLAADAGHVQSQHDYARNLKKQSDPSDYIRYLTSAAVQNHAQAKVDIRDVNPEQLCRMLVKQHNQLQQQNILIQNQQQHLQILTHCIGALSASLEKHLGEAFKLSELLPAGVTILGNLPESGSDTEEEFVDAVSTLEKPESVLH